MTLGSYLVDLRYQSTMYHINVKNPGSGSVVAMVIVDGISQENMIIHLIDDYGEHQVVMELCNVKTE